MKNKKPKVVQSPASLTVKYLTPNKKYKVVGVWHKWDKEFGYGFKINNDDNEEIPCLEKGCLHLGGKDWIIIKTE